MMHHTQRLAYANGATCADAKLDVDQSNPYRKTTKSYQSFRQGFRDAVQYKANGFLKRKGERLLPELSLDSDAAINGAQT